MNWISLLGLDHLLARVRVAAIEGAIAAEDRLDLARLEWQDQKRGLLQLLILAVAVTGLTVVSMVVLSIAVVVHFWDTPHRGLAGWLVSAVWLVLWVLALVGLLRAARRAGNGFALTRQELAQDWRDIKEQL
jgi:uncharacterized membrane protein YqjE|eukprot:gene12023-11817_t